jgi:AraC family transcriptional activator of pobA
MPKKAKSIPVNHFEGEHHKDMSIERFSIADIPDFTGEDQSERHDRHSFHLLEKGKITMEIDFQKHAIKAPALIYMHPNQVHRIVAFEHVVVSSWAINNENLNPIYLQLLEDISPTRPLALKKETFATFYDAVALGMKLYEQENYKLYHSILKDICNMLVALAISLYKESAKQVDKSLRFELVATEFKQILERNFTTMKRPVEYAQKLNISTPYLNECVRNATGHSVSYHIQQRIILEAKRLLYHSNRSVKEIADELGYDDPAYFSRLFTKTAGMNALAFRSKNLD